MTYKETTEYLFNLLPVFQRDGKAAYKNNLDNTIALDNYFGNPHKYFKSIHIAGTNGKGSTSHMISSVLQTAGLKTGLYTSPHLKDFRERIKINGIPVSENDIVEFVGEHSKIIEQLRPSFFEITVAMAFYFFKKHKVDIAVIETGMGGRLDSTNIITPLVSAITHIGFDHTQFLGDTIEKIAIEKAGIIKKMTPVVIGECPAEAKLAIKRKAEEMSAPFCCADERLQVNNIKQTNDHQEIIIKNSQSGTSFNYSLDLMGDYQQKNILVALTILEILTPMLGIEKQHIVQGLCIVAENTGLMGRWQTINKKPLTICDTGHNIDGLRFVTNQLKKLEYNKLHLVIGFSNDKNIEELISLFPDNALYYFCKPDIPRCESADKLYETGIKLNRNSLKFNSVKEAFSQANLNSAHDDIIFVGGSTFVVAEIV